MALSGMAIGIIIAAVIAVAGGTVGILFATGVLGGGDATAPILEYTINFSNTETQDASSIIVSAADSKDDIRKAINDHLDDKAAGKTIIFTGVFSTGDVAIAIKDGTYKGGNILYKLS